MSKPVTMESRWLGWGSPAEGIKKEPGTEPAKPSKPAEVSLAGFAGATPAQIQNFSLPEAEFAAYQEAFDAWIVERCVFRDCTWGGVRALHNDYTHWCTEQNRDVPARLVTFERLLRDVGSYVNESSLVYGIILLEDGEYCDALRGK